MPVVVILNAWIFLKCKDVHTHPNIGLPILFTPLLIVRFIFSTSHFFKLPAEYGQRGIDTNFLRQFLVGTDGYGQYCCLLTSICPASILRMSNRMPYFVGMPRLRMSFSLASMLACKLAITSSPSDFL